MITTLSRLEVNGHPNSSVASPWHIVSTGKKLILNLSAVSEFSMRICVWWKRKRNVAKLESVSVVGGFHPNTHNTQPVLVLLFAQSPHFFLLFEFPLNFRFYRERGKLTDTSPKKNTEGENVLLQLYCVLEWKGNVTLLYCRMMKNFRITDPSIPAR